MKERRNWKKQVSRKVRYIKAQFVFFFFCSANKGVVSLQIKMCGKGEMWSVHYHHGNVLRDQVTPHVLIFFLKDSAGRLKKLLLGVFIVVVFTYLKYFPNVTEIVVRLPLMNVFWLSRDRKTLHLNDNLTWTCLLVSFV